MAIRRGFSFLLALAAIGCASAPVADPAPRRSPSESLLREWLAAFNIGSLDSLTHFVAARFDSASLARRDARTRAKSDAWLRMNLGPMDLVRIDSTSDTTVTATVRQRLVAGWGHVTMRVTRDPPARIRMREISFFERGPSGVPVSRPSSDAELAGEMDRFARALTAAGIFSGVLLVARNGQPLLHAAYGLARRQPSVPVTVHTRFQLGSVSKMFTAVAIAQLVNAGRLRFVDTVAALLPDYPNREAARRLTVRHLLTHTSGLPEYFFSPRYAELQATLIGPRDYWPLFVSDSLRFAPGTQWEYSNSNYALLGAIVERISGQPFRNYVAERVFNIAGMTRTTYREGAAAADPDVAVGYSRFGPGRVPDLDSAHAVYVRPGQLAGSAGGGLSTALDLLRFSDALLGNRLLSAATTRAILEPAVASEDGEWTLGFESHTWNGVRFVGHNGFFDGAFNQVDLYPTLGYSFIVLSNTDMSGAGALAYHLRLLLSATP